jgi:hypothetical protein
MTWWRGVEQALLRDPRLEELASEMSAPFLSGAVALFLSDMARSLREQASEAQSAGLGVVEPVVAGPREFWEQATAYLEARSLWLDSALDTGAPPGLSAVAPLDPELRILRARLIERVRSAVGTPAPQA